MIKDGRGQYSLDLIIALGVFIMSITMGFYYVISAFVPHYERFDVYASASRIATLLCEDAGLNLTNISCINGNCTFILQADWEINGTVNSSSYDWYDAIGERFILNTTIKRVGLSDPYRIYTNYERCNPNVLNETKVKNFFNESWWNVSWRFKGQRDEEIWQNISVLLTLNSSLYHFNVSLRYLNGTAIHQIGYPIPKYGNVVRFERFVVVDREFYACLDKDVKNCLNSTSLRRLVVYVW